MDKALLLRLRLDGLTYAQIGEKVSLSRQRVQKLLQPPPLVRLALSDKYGDSCADCGIDLQFHGHAHHIATKDGVEDWNDLPNLVLLCISCHRRAHNTGVMLICKRCGGTWQKRDTLSALPKSCAHCNSPYWARPRMKPKALP